MIKECDHRLVGGLLPHTAVEPGLRLGADVACFIVSEKTAVILIPAPVPPTLPPFFLSFPLFSSFLHSLPSSFLCLTVCCSNWPELLGSSDPSASISLVAETTGMLYCIQL